MTFDDRVVLLAGVTGGFGPTLTRALAARGATLVLAARREGALAELAAECKLEPDRFLSRATDAARQESVDRLVQAALARFGRIDVLVNLVGGFRAGWAVHETSDEDWEAMLEINLRSTIRLCRAVVPAMIGAGRGRIVNVGSALGLHAGAGTAAYAVAKAGVLRLTEALAAELGPRGIAANAVIPSTIDTAANRAAMPGADTTRWVAADDLAAAICFLASDEAAGVNGALLPVYGRSGSA